MDIHPCLIANCGLRIYGRRPAAGYQLFIGRKAQGAGHRAKIARSAGSALRTGVLGAGEEQNTCWNKGLHQPEGLELVH